MSMTFGNKNRSVKNLIDQIFGRITVLYFNGFDNTGHTTWVGLCVCGNYVESQGTSLTTGKVKSCGCIHFERMSFLNKSHGFVSGTKEQFKFYQAFAVAKQRCLNTNDKDYERYGGRGITVCDRWLGDTGFLNFKEDKWESFLEHIKIHGIFNTSLDRISVDGPYSPENTRWATRKVQQNNRQNSAQTKDKEAHDYWKGKILTEMHRALKNKSETTESPIFLTYIGCDVHQFKRYLEVQFESWMNWDNLGLPSKVKQTWNIDHIIPLYKFDLSIEEDRLIAFNYKNTRPLNAFDNYRDKVRN
jgi:hypothetical protein